MPISLYIHIPWCIKKCPYCDFNSHQKPNNLQEIDYINALITDLQKDLERYPITKINSIFLGGGTPSLFCAKSYALLFDFIHKINILTHDAEITMEANPGAIDVKNFQDYKDLGINRLSLGVQSFNNLHLKSLGRIHDNKAIFKAFDVARKASFDNINIDLMYGLPQQTLQESCDDLNTAISLMPEHISWYELTLEPNTSFFKNPPVLPVDDKIYMMEQHGYDLLLKNNFIRYEISAFGVKNKFCMHNMNYWRFGDYLGIGAGAHGKITTNNNIIRTQKHRQPKQYLESSDPNLEPQILSKNDLIFEFMLNSTRLEEPISFKLFEERTKLDIKIILPLLLKAQDLNLIKIGSQDWQITAHGRNFTNDLQAMFLNSFD